MLVLNEVSDGKLCCVLRYKAMYVCLGVRTNAKHVLCIAYPQQIRVKINKNNENGWQFAWP